MPKKITAALLLAVCLCLILFSDACLSAARLALSLWWSNVLPALLPFSIFISLANAAGLPDLFGTLFSGVSRRLALPRDLLPCFLLGAVAGYPNGARMCASCEQPGMAAYCNLCSPVFLLGVVAHGLYQSTDILAPLCIAHYGSAILALCIGRLFGEKAPLQSVRGPAAPPDEPGLVGMVRQSVAIMAAIGGCMVLFYVVLTILSELGTARLLAAILQPLGASEAQVFAMLHGIMEFAGGCASIAALTVPLRLSVAMTAFTVSFGGLCVLMQTGLFLSPTELKRYFWQKLLQGLLAGLLAYVLTPVFIAEGIPVMQTAGQAAYLENALSGGSIFFASSVALAAVYLAGLSLQKLSARTQGPGAKQIY